MGRLFNSLPLFSTDYSAAASAVRDCGGLAIICCPDGCMGNYVRFDEPRWAEIPANVLQLELRERDVIFGDDDWMERFRTLDNLDGYGFIGLINTPVSSLIGMDTELLCRRIEEEFGIPSMSIPTNGYGNYHDGLSKAMLGVLDIIPEDDSPVGASLLGFSPLEYTESELSRIAEQSGSSAIFPGMGLESLKGIRNAEKSILLSSSAIGLAEVMERKYGIPYEPFMLREAAVREGDRTILIVGEQFRSNNLRSEIRHMGGDADVATFFTLCGRYSEPGDRKIESEEELSSLMSSGYKCVIGDPMLECLVPEDVRFIRDPQSAISSRLFWDDRIDVFSLWSLSECALRGRERSLGSDVPDLTTDLVTQPVSSVSFWYPMPVQHRYD